MTRNPKRQRIAFVAARLLHDQEETEYVRAKRRAARKLGLRFDPADLPSNREIRDNLRRITEIFDRSLPEGDPRRLRLEALRRMRSVADFDPILIGDVAAGTTEPGSSIDVIVFSDDAESVLKTLGDSQEIEWNREGLRPGSYAVLTIKGDAPIRLHLHPPSEKPSRRDGLSIDQLSQALEAEAPEGNLDDELEGLAPETDRFEIYRDLLVILEDVEQDPTTHPEGDALYHSLQVFDLAAEARGYDEEFLTAALLHDVGKAVTSQDHVVEATALLEGIVTHRTARLIAELPAARKLIAGELPVDERLRLEESEDFEDLMLLCELDHRGRASGVTTSSVDEAIAALRKLDEGDYF